MDTMMNVLAKAGEYINSDQIWFVVVPLVIFAIMYDGRDGRPAKKAKADERILPWNTAWMTKLPTRT